MDEQRGWLECNGEGYFTDILMTYQAAGLSYEESKAKALDYPYCRFVDNLTKLKVLEEAKHWSCWK